MAAVPFIDTPADAAFARAALDLSEQTCYLDALRRTPGLEPAVELTTL